MTIYRASNMFTRGSTLAGRHAAILAALVALTSVSATGCLVDPDHEIATATATSAIQSSRNAGSAHGLNVINTTSCPDPSSVASIAAGEPTVGLYPDGCATKTADGPDLHVEYNDCTGPFGKVHLRGGVDAVFSPGGACGKIHADVNDSGDLTGNDRKIEYAASADVTMNGDERDIDWTSRWTADTWLGEAKGDDHLSIISNATTHCLDVSGTSQAHLGAWELDSKLSGFTVCPDACPSAGTVEVVADRMQKDRKITITFDGTNKAHVVGTRGQAFDVDLVCD